MNVLKIRYNNNKGRTHYKLLTNKTATMTNYNKKALIQERLTLVLEYERIKNKQSKYFKRVKDLEEYSNHQRKVIREWYLKFIQSGRNPESILPQRRGPRKNPYGKPPKELERIVIKIFRRLNRNPLEIHFLLKRHKIINQRNGKIPSRAGIVNILKRYPTFKIKSKEITRYEKERAGELGHLDTKKIKNIKGQNPKRKKYLAALLDDATRITYCEKLSNKKAKTLSLFLRRATEWFRKRHGIIFKRILTDNGKEFTTHWKAGRKYHSFEREMRRLGIEHLYTRPYRPQTNGKVEAFWKIIKREFLTKYFFKDWREFNLKLHQYMYYYDQERRHGGLNYLTPYQKLLKSEIETKVESSTDGRTVEKKLTSNSNHFVTKLVR